MLGVNVDPAKSRETEAFLHEVMFVGAAPVFAAVLRGASVHFVGEEYPSCVTQSTKSSLACHVTPRAVLLLAETTESLPHIYPFS